MADYNEPISDTEKVGKVTLEVDLVTICLGNENKFCPLFWYGCYPHTGG